MVTSSVALGGPDSVKEREKLLGSGNQSPVPHQFAEDGKKANNMNASCCHPVIRDVPDQVANRARGFHVRPDGVAGLAKRQGKESSAYVRHDATDDELSLASGADGCLKLRVVPGVDLPGPLNNGGIRVRIEDLIDRPSVRSYVVI